MELVSTNSDSRDVQSIAKLCDEIANGDWYYGTMETKLKLIVVIAERMAATK